MDLLLTPTHTYTSPRAAVAALVSVTDAYPYTAAWCVADAAARITYAADALTRDDHPVAVAHLTRALTATRDAVDVVMYGTATALVSATHADVTVARSAACHLAYRALASGHPALRAAYRTAASAAAATAHALTAHPHLTDVLVSVHNATVAALATVQALTAAHQEV